MRIVRFGDAIVFGPDLTPEQRERNVRESTEALARALPRLATPGVNIRRKPGVPLFYANKHRARTVIRELDGRQEVGTLDSDGTWHPIEGEPPITN